MKYDVCVMRDTGGNTGDYEVVATTDDLEEARRVADEDGGAAWVQGPAVDGEYNRHSSPGYLKWVAGTVMALVLIFLATGCVDDGKIVKAVEAQGYTQVHVDDWSWVTTINGCGDDDSIAYDMTATNSRGARVSLVVCAGRIFKGVTVRTQPQ